ncbi:TetR family transcriptional regulator [Pseudoroseomonas wenyumeiae]|uniref:TetR family transcriptional regulator n=1 Tax=Teichococcus wenyumeiae TaxID=2478470 RepID=A0A3A9J719_9PROT|nr:TetR/AcrR family transcriptional regulator [Pseudoroseomonas wenyumeiae]RKK01451.1 TetR/AcrR family transcriptional regulator [Pseudoroseomonas wenyumeiae]RMI20849.1 TetR family transcriptional regulator [Pseudoroseomonas wenyumeiae]
MSARGRPRGFDRDAALDAATLLFWLQGYAATSMAELCQAMGIASPSLYAAFGSKEALYAEAIARYAETYGPLIWGPLEAGESARAGVEGLLMASAALLPAGERPGGCMITLSLGGDCQPELRALLRQGREKGLRRIEARLERGREAGDLPPGADIPAMARFYLGVQQGMSVQARDGASREELEQIARNALRAWDTLAG